MNHALNCKFCHRPITVQIDDSYSELGDPFKILSLACCNRCSDLRVERRRLSEKISRICRKVSIHKSSEAQEEYREILVKLTQRYANLIAKFHDKDGMCWDDAIVESLMDNPEQWPSILSQMWKSFQQSQERLA